MLLTAQLPVYLPIADADAGDNIVTPLPAKIHTTDKTDLEDYPAIELIVTGSDPVADSHAQVYRHTVIIGYTVAGDDEETLSVWVERYAWAIRQICRDAIVDPFGGPIDTGAEHYTLIAQRPEGLEIPFVRGGFTDCFIPTVE